MSGGDASVGAMFHFDPNGVASAHTNEGYAPGGYRLFQNFPNPFNPKTVVSSQLPVASYVRLVVYDLLGREVAVLANEQRATGSYRDTFDGSRLSSGVYICRFTAGEFVQTKAMMLVK